MKPGPFHGGAGAPFDPSTRATSSDRDPLPRVLVAVSDYGERELLSLVVANAGHDVVATGDGLRAERALVDDEGPEIAFIDAALPRRSGAEIVERRWRSRLPRRGYVVLVVDRHSPEEARRALEVGADAVVARPFDADEVSSCLVSATRCVSARRRSRGPTPATADGDRFGVGRAAGGATVRLQPKRFGHAYEDGALLHVGRHAEIWTARHAGLGGDVAIKVARGDGPLSAWERWDFGASARIAASCRSPNVVGIVDVGSLDGGCPFLVMERLRGFTLAAHLRRYGPMTPSAASRLVAEVGQGIADMHGAGVFHRAIRPSNIMLTVDDDRPEGPLPYGVKIIDFGRACSAARPGREGELEGDLSLEELAYISPEALSGDPIDARQDAWALGACAFAALTGKAPFGGTSAAAVKRAVCEAPLPVPSRVDEALGPGIDAWFARVCARRDSPRFSSLREIAASFAAACEDAERRGRAAPSSWGPPPQ